MDEYFVCKHCDEFSGIEEYDKRIKFIRAAKKNRCRKCKLDVEPSGGGDGLQNHQ